MKHTDIPLTPARMDRLRQLMDEAAARAGANLSQMTHCEVEFGIRSLAVMDAADLKAPGIPDHIPCAMVALRFSGGAEGFAVFLMYEESAKKINELLWGEIAPADGFVQVSSVSALKEMGNIVGSEFLNSLSDRLGVDLAPSQPTFCYDMVGALMDAIMIEECLIAPTVVVLETEMRIAAEGIEMRFLFLPSASLFDRLKEHGE